MTGEHAITGTPRNDPGRVATAHVALLAPTWAQPRRVANNCSTSDGTHPP